MLLLQKVNVRINSVLQNFVCSVYLNNADWAIFPKWTSDACRKCTSFAFLYEIQNNIWYLVVQLNISAKIKIQCWVLVLMMFIGLVEKCSNI